MKKEYYNSYREILKHTKPGSVIQLDPLKGYYITSGKPLFQHLYERR